MQDLTLRYSEKKRVSANEAKQRFVFSKAPDLRSLNSLKALIGSVPKADITPLSERKSVFEYKAGVCSL
jgi:hypothetical protein